MEHTFRKISSEAKLAYAQNKKYACFNTGLVTENLEEIYAFFEENRVQNDKASPYFFRAFIKKSDREFLNIFAENPPERADYFSNPDLLIFNPNYAFIPDIDHIIEDSIHRFPKTLQSATPKVLRTLLGGAIEEVKKIAKTNYRLAIPQYRENKIHLLLPLHLEDEVPDLALCVEQINRSTYSCYMCLTMGMAYNNARLIVCPLTGEWLKP